MIDLFKLQKIFLLYSTGAKATHGFSDSRKRDTAHRAYLHIPSQ